MIELERDTARSRGWTTLFALTIFALVSRGLLELLLPKGIAYGLQVAGVILFLIALFTRGGGRVRYNASAQFLLSLAFVFVGLVSSFASLDSSGNVDGLLHAVVTFFFVMVIFFFNGVIYPVFLRIAIAPVLSTTVAVLLLFALLQQFFGLSALPGSDTGTFGSTVRPASITGSFLHYPLIMSLLAIILLAYGSKLRQRRYYFFAGLAVFGSVSSFSRSAILLLAVGVVVSFALSRNFNFRLRVAVLGVLSAVASLVFFPQSMIVERFLSIFDSDGAGNATRIAQWADVLQLWLDSPLLFGTHAGEFTNIVSNLTGRDTEVAESGVLQLLVSFGLAGLVTFYALLLMVWKSLPSEAVWLRAGLLAAISQTAVYQSIEVLPFMVLLALFPPIAQNLYEKTNGAEVLAEASRSKPQRRR